jgi:cardiolipin synthase
MKYKGWLRVNGRIDRRAFSLFYFIILSLSLLIIHHLSEPKQIALPDASCPVFLYSNQTHDPLEKTITKAISQAKESIVCMIYSINDEAVIDALKERSEKGVSVLVVHDPVASFDAKAQLGPSIQTVPYHHKGLMHNKLLSIDHKQVWLGSANFTKDSLLLHANLVLGFESPHIAQAIEQKASGKHYKEPVIVCHKNQEIEVRFLPDNKTALTRLLSLLQAAQKTLNVAMFTFTHPQLIDAVIQAHKRGVAVEVVLDSDSSRKTSKTAYTRFMKEGVPIRISDRKGLLHEKIAIIDGDTLVCGSANWTKAAFSSNDETLVIVHPLTQEQKEKLSVFWDTTIQESKMPERRKAA